ncbi:MAG: squalene/phytoene synthase family protein [Rhodobiaceae bacterium]|nr:squalene/phytoene synthase family protein [Rhodobiaceae bacterium]
MSAAADALRAGDKDRFLATLFADASVREDIFALYAFNLEIARVREIVSEPMIGEIRLQWWRDVLAGTRDAEAAAHPVAGALMQAVRRHGLSSVPLDNLIAARTFDLYADPMPTLNDLEGYCGETSSVLLQLAATILNGGADPDVADAAGHGGVAYALTGLLRALPIHAARGQVFLPKDLADAHGVRMEDLTAGRDTPEVRKLVGSMADIARGHLDKARDALKAVPDRLFAAFLPLALVEPHLDRMAARDVDPFRPMADIPQWRRQWRLYRSARRGRI